MSNTQKVCEWYEDEDGVWDTACGAMWEFINDGPKENNMKFCHNCGKKVVISGEDDEKS